MKKLLILAASAAIVSMNISSANYITIDDSVRINAKASHYMVK